MTSCWMVLKANGGWRFMPLSGFSLKVESRQDILGSVFWVKWRWEGNAKAYQELVISVGSLWGAYRAHSGIVYQVWHSNQLHGITCHCYACKFLGPTWLPESECRVRRGPGYCTFTNSSRDSYACSHLRTRGLLYREGIYRLAHMSL